MSERHSQIRNLPETHLFSGIPTGKPVERPEINSGRILEINTPTPTPEKESQENALNGVELTNSARFPEIEEELFGTWWKTHVLDVVKKLGGSRV